ncbi:hypothetical protein [Streptomyces sp. YGL11-2]|uniref:hypothetical protein n=1 Tax=Streptomyces sp. YGL11-2 TaxID=3414028 RepID=UPI003CEC320A
MDTGEEQIRRGVTDAAHHIGPLDISLQAVAGKIRNRRRLLGGTAASFGIILIGSAAWGAAIMFSPAAAPNVRPAGQETTPSGIPFPHQARSYACGNPIQPPVAHETGNDALDFRVTSPRRTPSGAPEITVTLTARKAASIPVPLTPTAPRILLLKDGKIVAGQDSNTAPSPGVPTPTFSGTQLGVAHALRLAPGEHYSVTVTLPADAVCDGHSWSELWSPGEKTTLAVIASDRALGRTHPLDPHALNPDPLVVQEQPLQNVPAP